MQTVYVVIECEGTLGHEDYDEMILKGFKNKEDAKRFLQEKKDEQEEFIFMHSKCSNCEHPGSECPFWVAPDCFVDGCENYSLYNYFVPKYFRIDEVEVEE